MVSGCEQFLQPGTVAAQFMRGVSQRAGVKARRPSGWHGECLGEAHES